MTTKVYRSILECRQAIAENGGKLKAVAGDTFDKLQNKLEKVKENGGHVADLRRLRNEAAAWVAGPFPQAGLEGRARCTRL